MTLIDNRQKRRTQITKHKERLKHQSWCHKNKIHIYLQPETHWEARIVVERNGVKEVGAYLYRTWKRRVKDEKWEDVIWKLYTQIYYEENKDNLKNNDPSKNNGL
jgi:hypothetical protein